MPTARSVDSVSEYHERSVVALKVLERNFENLHQGERVLFPRHREPFVDVVEGMRDELDDEVVLALMASAERVLRLDFNDRLGGEGRAAVRFGHLKERFGNRVPLEEILDVWKDLTGASYEFGAFKQMYSYRHGLAHGRYFNKSGRHHATPRDAASVVQVVFEKIREAFSDFASP